MPWERIQEQLKRIIDPENVLEWPLPPWKVPQIVRVRLVNASQDEAKRARELRVRAEVVLAVANIYIEHNIEELQGMRSFQDLAKLFLPRELTCFAC